MNKLPWRGWVVVVLVACASIGGGVWSSGLRM